MRKLQCMFVRKPKMWKGRTNVGVKRGIMKRVVCYMLIFVMLFLDILPGVVLKANTSTEVSGNAGTEITISDNELTDEVNSKGEQLVIDEAALTENKIGAEAEGMLQPMKASEIKEGFSDYAPYLTKHEIKVDGKVIESGTVIEPAQSFALSLQFSLLLTDMAADGLKYYFKLPKHISIGNQGSEAEQITLYNSARVPLGTYYIEDDVMYVTFPGYYDSIMAFFNMEASWSETENKAQITVDWNETEDLYYIDICDLAVAKTHSGYKSADDGSMYVDFKVKVYPEKEGVSIDDITFWDTFSCDELVISEHTYGQDKAICLTKYNSDGTVNDTTYYKLSEVMRNGYTFTIEPISIENGGYFEVTYKAELPLEKRIEIDAKNEKDSYKNQANVSYPYIDAESGQTQTLSASATVKGEYNASDRWVFKEQGNDTYTKEMDGEEKEIIPYVITINKHRSYSLGGSIVQDEITEFQGGSVVYDTTGTTKKYGVEYSNYVEILDKNGARTQEQKWVVLDASLYSQVQALASASVSTSLARLQAEDTLESALVTAINAAHGTTYTEFSDEVALQYVFTGDVANNFVWFMPHDETPTTYTIHYNTIVDAAVGSFKNSASLWYTEYESVPKGPGIGWTRPVKKVLNASKMNYGVYIGEDGNYYVDYKITVGLEAGSVGFEDIAVKEMLPYHMVTVGGQEIPVFDWLKGIDAESVDITSLTEEQNRQLVEPLVKVSTQSTDPAVLAVVENSYSGFHYECNGDFLAEAYRTGEALSSAIDFRYASTDPNDGNNKAFMNGNYKQMAYRGEAAEAGQFLAKKDMETLRKGQTLSVGGILIWLGDMPGTEEGYTIDIEFTLQVNPYLIKKMPEILEQTGEEYIENVNHAGVWTSFYDSNREEMLMNLRSAGQVQSMSSPYWIGVNDSQPGLTKNVVPQGSGLNGDDGTVTYEMKVNPENAIKGENVIYEVTDVLGLSGINYAPGTVVVKDEGGRIVWSEDGNPAVDAAYTSHAAKISLEKTDYERESNSFHLKIDNDTGLFTVDDKLMQLTIQYDVDITSIATDVDIVNDAALCKLETGPDGSSIVRMSLGDAHVEYSVDKALDKVIVTMPTKDNDAIADFYVNINPDSSNAYQLKNIQAGEHFTVRDEMGDDLVPVLNTVKVFRYQGDNYVSPQEITSACRISYDDYVMDVEIPVTATGYKYRIYYSAMVNNPAEEYMAFDNEVSVLGTDIRKDKVDSRTWVYSYNEGTEATAAQIDLYKYDRYDTNKGIKAKFDLYRLNNGVWECITTEEYGHGPIETDADGKVTIKNNVVNATDVMLVTPETWYKLVEIETEPGYVLDPIPIYYYTSNSGVALSEEEVPEGIDSYKLLKLKNLSEINDTIPVLYVSNQKFGFEIQKADSSDKRPLEGAEFSLYSDADCTALMKTAVSNTKGMASFSNIDLPQGNVTLFLKETKAPDNYEPNATVYTLNIEDCKITSVVDAEGNAVELSNEGHVSLVTIYNEYDGGRILIKKEVYYGNEHDKEQEFPFTLHIYDAAGNAVSDTYDAIVTAADGTETQTQYTPGEIFYLKHLERMMVLGIPAGYRYKVSEVYDQNYHTLVKMRDSVNKTDDTGQISRQDAEGTFEAGNIDTIEYVNQATDRLRLEKKALAPNGEEMQLPDGLAFTISNSAMNKVAEVEWDSYQNKFILTYKANSRIQMDNSIPNGFELSCIKTDGGATQYYIAESNAEIDGMGLGIYYKEHVPNVNNGYDYCNGLIRIGKHNREFNDLKVDVENRYTNNYTEAKLDIRKEYNIAIPADTFRFGLYDANSSYNYGNDSNRLIQTAYAGADGKVDFDSLTFTRTGNYSYYVKEIIPEDAVRVSGTNNYIKDGIIYYITEIKVKIKVEKNDLGQYEVVSILYDDEEKENASLKNEYAPEGEWQPAVRKKLENKDLKAADFSFTLTEYTDNTYGTVTGETQTKSNEAPAPGEETASVIFDKITYTYDDIGTHYYIVSEEIPQDAVDGKKGGMTYDDTQYKIAVEVTDNGDGTLKVTPNYNNGANEYVEITNVYDPKGSVTFSGSKRMLYDDLAADAYSFELTEYTDASRTTAKTTENGAAIRYTFGHAAGRYDETDKYAEGDIDYPTLNYTVKDIGTHYYTLKEVVPQNAVNGVVGDIKYDTAERKIVVDVTDKQDGTLAADVMVEDGKSFTFVNAHQQEIEVNFTGNKKLYGRMMQDGEFGFWANLYSAPIDNPSDTKLVGSGIFGYSLANGEIIFAKQSITMEDIGKRYTYYIAEYPYAANASVGMPGVTYDHTYYQIDVDVTLDANRNLKADVKQTIYQSDREVASIDFNNTYDAEGEVIFTATKLLENKEITDKEFEFGIYEGETLLSKGSNDADGKVTFEPIKYYIDGEVTGVDAYIGKHTYTIKEIIPDNPKAGYIYDTTEYTVVVDAVDDGMGNIDVRVLEGATAENNPAGISYQITTPADKNATFENGYEAKGSLVLEGTKVLTGRSLKDKEFTFTAVEYKLDAGQKKATGRSFKGSNTAAGKIVFDAISYEYTKNQKDTGVYYYHITEDKVADDKGIVCDASEIVYECLVTHVGDGKLEATGVMTNKEIKFVNSYEPKAQLTVETTKKAITASGDAYEDTKNTFDIEVYEIDQNKQEKLVTVIAVKAGESAVSAPIEYTIKDVGVHQYKVVEKAVEKPGYANDTNVYYITAEVKSDESKHLQVTVKNDKGEVIATSENGKVSYATVFTNTYSAKGQVVLKGKKKVEHADKMLGGYKLSNGEFTFTIYEVKKQKGKKVKEKVSSGKNSSDGTIDFKPIKYTLDDVGTHKYVISEEKDSKSASVLNVAEDVSVIVDVSDNGDGTLKVEVTYENNAKQAVFINRATEIVIDKVTAGGKLLEGARLQIFDEKEKTVTEFTTTGKSESIYGLKKNTVYTLSETSAPSGYLVAENIKFTIGDDGTVYLVKDGKNKKVNKIVMTDYDVPNKTGDTSRIWMFMALMLLSLGALFGLTKMKSRLK